MVPLRVLAVADPPDRRLASAVFMVADALDANRPDCELPLHVRVHAGRGEARTSLVDGELWIDLAVPANADPLPMVVLESVWDALRLAQSRHPEARIAFPVARARSLLSSIEERMERNERAARMPAPVLPAPAVLVAAMTAVFDAAGPGMPSFRVTRRRRRR